MLKPRLFKPRPDPDPPEKEAVVADGYLILQCPACERDVKVNSASAAGMRMGCPYCREPLEIMEWEPELAPAEEKKRKKKREEAPIVRQPLVFRHLKDGDVSTDHDLEFADEYDRRQMPYESPKWDNEEFEASRREREGAAAGASVDGEGAEPGTFRARPQSPKRLLTRREQVFRTITILIMGSGLIVAGIILYSAIFRGVAVVRQDGENMKQLPAEIRKTIDEALTQDAPISEFLTSAEENAAVAIVNGFLNAESVEDRLPFVRHPERVEPLMQAWYARPDVVTDWPDGTVLLRDKRIDQGRYFIRLAINFGGKGNRIFVVEQTVDDLKLDWETAVGYQPQTLADFKAERPTSAVEFRVKLKPSDYYNNQFGDRDRFQAIDLSYPGDEEFKLTGYVDRKHDWAAALISDLEKGEAPSMIVKLRFPEGEIVDDTLVEITEIVAETWWP